MDWVDAKFLSRAEEQALFRRLRRYDDREAHAALCQSVMPLAMREAKRFAKQKGWRNLDDAIGAAMLGVVQAVGHFRPSKGCRLTTYAFRCIRSELARAHVQDQTIRTPHYYNGNFHSVKDKYAAQIAACYRSLSLSGFETLDKLAALDAGDYDQIDRDQEIAWLYAAIERLDARSRWILRQRLSGRTLVEIGRELGVTRERVRQLELAAKEELRELAKNPRGAGG